MFITVFFFKGHTFTKCTSKIKLTYLVLKYSPHCPLPVRLFALTFFLYIFHCSSKLTASYLSFPTFPTCFNSFLCPSQHPSTKSQPLFITCNTNKLDIYTSANHSQHVFVMFPVKHTQTGPAGHLPMVGPYHFEDKRDV